MTPRAVLALGLIVLALGTVALLAGGLGGDLTIEEINRSFVLEPGQEIFVRSRNGAISYENWDGDEVVIRASKKSSFGLIPVLSKWINERTSVEFSQDAKGVRAVHHSPFRWLPFSNVGVQFHVQVPQAWQGEISLQTSNGRITAKDLHGEATLRTSNGAIYVERQSGRLEVNTSNGRIELNEVNGVVQATTSNGPVRVSGGTLAQDGRVRTSNGAIELRAKLDRDAAYELRTSNGRVTLVLVDPDVDVDMRTTNGDIDLDTELAVRELGRSRLVGRIGQGGARLNVRTSNGDISLATTLNSP